MKVIACNAANPDPTAISEAAKVIQGGGVVAYPSDSSYGLACDPTNPAAMAKLYELKGRPKEKSVSYNFGSIDEIATWAELSGHQRAILKKNLPGRFTFLLTPKKSQPVLRRPEQNEKIGVRIPDQIVVQALVDAVGFPITATSANLSGEPAAYSADAVRHAFPNPDLQPNLLLDAGELPGNPASTLVDLTTDPPIVTLRGGREPDLIL